MAIIYRGYAGNNDQQVVLMALLHKTLKEIQAEKFVKKTKVRTPKFDYNYMKLEEILDIVEPILRKNELVLLFTGTGREGIAVEIFSERAGSIELAHVTREQMDIHFSPQSNSNTAKEFGITMSYIKRYLLVSALGLNVRGEDTDGNFPIRPVTRPGGLSVSEEMRAAAKNEEDKKMQQRLYDGADKWDKNPDKKIEAYFREYMREKNNVVRPQNTAI